MVCQIVFIAFSLSLYQIPINLWKCVWIILSFLLLLSTSKVSFFSSLPAGRYTTCPGTSPWPPGWGWSGRHHPRSTRGNDDDGIGSPRWWAWSCRPSSDKCHIYVEIKTKEMQEIFNDKLHVEILKKQHKGNCCNYKLSSVESQKGAITIQRCSVENQKGAITIDIRTAITPFWFSTEHLWIVIAPLLALNWRYNGCIHEHVQCTS